MRCNCVWSLRPLVGACCLGIHRRTWSSPTLLFPEIQGSQPAQKKEQGSVYLCICAYLLASVHVCMCVAPFMALPMTA